MLQHSYSSASLSINVCSASELVSVQHIGKQDPYLRFSLDFTQKDSYLKTFTHKNGGDNAVWNQSFTISLSGEPDLFVEVLDEENTVDEVIGFCAIPINQVVHAQGANMNGVFEIFNTKGERSGLINLQLAAVGFPNSQPPNFDCSPVQGHSYVHEEHAARVKSIKKKAAGVAIGGALLGGALAIGAGFLGKKLYDDHQEHEEQERLEQEEAQRRQEQEERERREFQEERARLEQEKNEFARRQEEYNEEESHHHHHHHHDRRNSNSSDEGDAKKWNPVGTYAAGDRVKYHGNVYMCLQGHTSNPTWAPNYAHSLWQTE